MAIVETVIGLILIVLVSNLINHYFKWLPVSLVQILLGTIIALIFNLKIDLDANWFLLLFIAPLLYNDGRRFPRKELWKLKGPIFNNAILLVFLTMLVGGFLIAQLIPSMPLPVGIALAAVLAPTDPIAVHSISKQVRLPENVLHLVSGESLINDASGLIGFKYAIAIVITGYFSLFQAVGDFFYVSIIGAIAGLLLMGLVILIIEWLIIKDFNDVVFNTVLQVSIPFIIYLVTEKYLHASGVIAVVVAGVFFASQRNNFISVQPEINLVTERTWDIIAYLLNGTMFTILGVELPFAMQGAIKSDRVDTFRAFLLIGAVWLILLIIRVCWTFVYQLFDRQKTKMLVRLKIALISGLSGVRGAITMAGVLTIPLTIASGSPFPERSLVLFLAAGVIILSMLMAILVLPFLAGKSLAIQTRGANTELDAAELESDEEQSAIAEEQIPILTKSQAKLYILKNAVRSLEEQRRQQNQLAVYQLILEYQYLIKKLEISEEDQPNEASIITDELKLNRVAIKGQQKELKRLYQSNQIQQNIFQYYQKRLEHQLKEIDHGVALPHFGLLFSLKRMILSFDRHFKVKHDAQQGKKFMAQIRLAERALAKTAIKTLSEYLRDPAVNEKKFNREAIYHLIIRYRTLIEKQKNQASSDPTAFQQQMKSLRLKSINVQRLSLQFLIEQGYLDHRAAMQLRQYINHEENLLLRVDPV
ncbi:cation:proton antiporter [Liquorilactobacillus sicerae]|uniref:cation:proton antiporter domain-containing protein n=1 Tax=Liquorilactobacillus sicerae TaxID=1416943 RepID=UPI002480D67C